MHRKWRSGVHTKSNKLCFGIMFFPINVKNGICLPKGTVMQIEKALINDRLCVSIFYKKPYKTFLGLNLNAEDYRHLTKL